jgi:hypothetical protein
MREIVPPAEGAVAHSRDQNRNPLTPLVAFEWMLALAITAVALFLFFNGSVFSTYDSLHIDFSINWTASHALLDGEIPYGKTTLAERAATLGGPTNLIYSQLYTSYIQPPTSALHLAPLTALDWREATHAYLVLNHLLLFAAVGITLGTVKPELPIRWLIAGVTLILALYSQLYMSFTLGQVDATIFLLLSIAFWGYANDKPAITGTAIALATAIKLIPALLLLYLLWRREFRSVVWAVVVGAVLFLASLAFVGVDTYRAFFEDTLPGLMKGSTQYSNISFGAMVARLNSPEVFGGLADVFSLDEPPTGTRARVTSAALTIATLLIAALILGWESRKQIRAVDTRPPVFEFYFVIAVALLISSVTWEFYVIWLLPVFLTAFLAPGQYLPSGPVRWLLLAGFVVAYVALNYPGDLYLFGPNDFFYHPEWVPGQWVEDRVWLYHGHFDAVLYLRLPALMFLVGLLGFIVLWQRWHRTGVRSGA